MTIQSVKEAAGVHNTHKVPGESEKLSENERFEKKVQKFNDVTFRVIWNIALSMAVSCLATIAITIAQTK